MPPLCGSGGVNGPLELTVQAADDPPARIKAVAFIEAELDSPDAWVQQAVGYVLRLYYATPLVSGELEQPQPEGATLQRVGDDLQYSRDIGGRRYSVVERRFLLVPDRSGPLDIPAARFRGRGTGSFFDDRFGSGPRVLRASGEPQRLQVRPMPDGAPRPWLPLRGLEARFLEVPHSARAGEAVEWCRSRAPMARRAQIPAPELRRWRAGFAEPGGCRTLDGGRRQVTRRFRWRCAAPLRLSGPLQVGCARRRSADLALPPPSITAAMELSRALAGAFHADATVISVGGAGRGAPWAVAAAFALLWLATLGDCTGVRRRPGVRLPSRATAIRPPSQAQHAPIPATLAKWSGALCAADAAGSTSALRPAGSGPKPRSTACSGALGAAIQLCAACMREAFAGPRWIDGNRAGSAYPARPVSECRVKAVTQSPQAAAFLLRPPRTGAPCHDPMRPGRGRRCMPDADRLSRRRTRHRGQPLVGRRRGCRAINYVSEPIGQLFLRLLFMLVVPLVFSALILGVVEIGDPRSLGRLGFKAMLWVVGTTTIAVTIGLVVTHIMQPGAGIDPALRDAFMADAGAVVATGNQPLGIVDMLLNMVPRSPVQAAADNDLIAVMFFSLVFGVARRW